MKKMTVTKKVAKDRIVKYLLNGDITLHADEERMMLRWMYVDSLIRSKKFRREEVIQEVVKKFEVSKFTADADIRYAHQVFARTRQMNRNYLLGHLVEDLTMYIEKAKRDPELKKIVPGLYKQLITAINSLPDEATADKLPPATIMFNLFDAEKLDTGITPEEAMEKAKKFLDRQAIEDIDYEDA